MKLFHTGNGITALNSFVVTLTVGLLKNGLAAAAVLAVATVPGTSTAQGLANTPWPMYGGNQRHTSQAPGGFEPTFNRHIRIHFRATRSPIIDNNGLVYVMGSMDQQYGLFVFNPDLTLNWQYTPDYHLEPHMSPVIGANGIVYACFSTELHAVAPGGTLVWKTDRGGSYSNSSPALAADSTIYVPTRKDGLHAYNYDGTLKWSSPVTVNEITASAPAIGADGTVYIGSRNGNLYAINPDGSIRWSYHTGDKVYSSPAIGANGTIYVGSDDTHIYAIYPDGSLRWRFKTGDRVTSSPMIDDDGSIYIGSKDGNLYRLSPEGRLMWKYTIGAGIRTTPSLGYDGTIYIGANDGFVYAINPDGSIRWKYQSVPYNNYPLIPARNGAVYFGNSNYLNAIPMDTASAVDTQPTKFTVDTPYPNPFNASATIGFTLPERGFVDIAIHNILGQCVRLLAAREYPAGGNTVVWYGRTNKGETVTTGVYFVRIRYEETAETLKLLFLR